MKKTLVAILLVLLPPTLYVVGVRYGLPPVMDIASSGDCTASGAFAHGAEVCVDRIDYVLNPLGAVFAGIMAIPFVATIAMVTHSLFHRIMQKHV